ncbi:protein kinase domain-containing protein [Novipirellula artificiosorum]|uniref:Serine/threonine-protein kinase PknB n=1 Tax=Novipirellula artificiosorum TaxID=2528016 RepID=A0A5C6DT13_9BACT|nr:protein kinase [Novipirellula artificiosorum]TWU39334.1 Serine/threonine-protein kinase PknB [Novipirellula artificiosorum]
MASDHLSDKDLFNIARQLDSLDAVEVYLEQVCGDNAERYERILKLVEADKGDSFLEKPLVPVPETVESRDPVESEGETIDNYVLLQKIGEGGFGVVYMAEQTSPVRRKVALKIIKPGMDSKEIVGRFEAERQALAMMSHPNIASVFDGGYTPTGRPYFVMELVRGVSITKFCDAKRLGLEQRLRLLMDVCRAVQHAHQKGIIHRDLKPSNVMVTFHDGTPVVKVIDFGVAKAINQQLTDNLFFTRYGQMIGTPQYMSPEQAEMSGLGVDTLSDIYSLGVLMYELLVGTTPLTADEFREAGHLEVQRMICEQEPVRPSDRLSTTEKQQLFDIAEHRGLKPDLLASQIRGDLEWIVMRTLEKERDRRYPTPLDLCRDVERYLDNQPVEARPPSMVYRMRKYVRRHRALVGSSAAICLTMIAATVFSTAMWRHSDEMWRQSARDRTALAHQRDETDAARKKAELQAELNKQLAKKLAGQLYRTQIQKASELEFQFAYDDAREVLAECPENQRDWEYDRLMHLVTNFDSPIPGCQVPLFPGRGDQMVSIGLNDNDGGLCIWDIETQELLDVIPVSELELMMSALHPDNQLVAVADREGNLFLVDLESRQVRHKIDRAHSGRVNGLGFSPDGSRLASCCHDGQLKLWDVESAMMLASKELKDQLRGIEFDARGRYLATGVTSTDDAIPKIRIFDAETLDFVRHLKLEGEYAKSIAFAKCIAFAFSPSGDFLVGGGASGVVIWNTETWQVEQDFSGHLDNVKSVRFRPDGEVLAACGDHMIQFWDWRLGKLTRTIKSPSSYNWWSNFSPDQHVFAYFDDRCIRVHRLDSHDKDTNKRVIALEGLRDEYLVASAFSSDGNWFAAAGTDRSIMVWDTTTWTTKQLLHGHQSTVRELVWDHDGSLYSTDADGVVIAWDVPAGKPSWQHRTNADSPPQLVHLMAVAPGKSKLLFGTPDRGILELNRDALSQSDLAERTSNVTALASSPDGQWVAYAAGQKVVIRDFNGQASKVTVRVPAGRTKNLVFSPDSRTLAGLTTDWYWLFDLESGELKWKKRHSRYVWGLAFSKSGKRLFLMPDMEDYSAMILDSNDGNVIYEWAKQGSYGLAYDPTNETVACIGAEGKIQIFEASERHRPTVPEFAKSNPTEQHEIPYRMQTESRKILFRQNSERYMEALELATKATKCVPDCPEYEFTKGVALFRSGHLKEADEALKGLEGVQWNHIDNDALGTAFGLQVYARAVRSIVLYQLGNADLAREQLELARKGVRSLRTNQGPVYRIVAEAESVLAEK